ncbi:polysaccharide deacetylase family protein [Paeniglutamicibacter gangotriensis]|uniref:Polysaccharide deacetylase n=1 Tax=Paeniglutamicibacter gangotriensis Lz1y TaxID=1276920 RepID=M7N5J1_9MICC|nr:polysaccharide deacetylase family protein [Paeniglutamicibacter gangotriensis]EMQ97034.1 polysaccharide deacetylase [Paeniglutamicibacter gangotriensis Lz1y]
MPQHTERFPLAARRTVLGALLGTGAALLSSCVADPASPRVPPSTAAASASTATPSNTPAPSPSAAVVPTRAQLLAEMAGRPAGSFGLEVKGVSLRLPASAHGAALTFDACGGPNGEGYDAVLIEALRTHRAPATLFINRRWAQVNTALVRELAADPLFEIANHGTTHAPLASRGQVAYGIPGTADLGAAYDEVMGNQHYLADTFGIQARFFRSGTAHLDELGAAMCRQVGLVPMNFSVNLDAGATFGASTVSAQTARLGVRDVGIGHFNRPAAGTAAGVAAALPGLLEALEANDQRLYTLSEAFGLDSKSIPSA